MLPSRGNGVSENTTSTGTSKNAAIEGTVVSWLKRFVDDDDRYTSLLCPADLAAPVGSLSAYVSTCANWR